MKRRDRQGLTSDLPQADPATLDVDELLYLRHMLGLIETGDMFHGRFVEVHVGRVLGADLPDRGVNEWDLWLNGDPSIGIEVKATALGGTYRLRRTSKAARKPKSRQIATANVWVFVTFADKTRRPRKYSYLVLPASVVAGLSDTISQKRLFRDFGPPITEHDLPSAVHQAAAATLRGST